MEHTVSSIEMLYEKAKKYTQTSINLLALNTVDKTADVLSSLTARLIIASVVAMFILFINIGFGLFIGKLLNAYYLGFFIVSGFYLILAFAFYIFKDKLIKEPIANEIISIFLKPNKSGFSMLDDLKDNEDEDNK
jgi:hypothetical protein